MRKLYLIFTISLLSLSLFGQEDQYDKIMDKAFPATGPGATAIVVKKGEIVYHKAFGLANVELDVPMQTDHVFRIGSITKQFTSMAILQLMERGKLSLDDEITKFIPDYPTRG
ncbi:MAG: serine hydrolase domain-containing protein, partial [Bacteroidota bacterium]